jgi:cytochrome c oxidase cbb3-type subunit 3
MSQKVERDDVTGTETTGHEWDGIKELNTPLPRWWLYTLYGTIIWALGYSVAYPAWPLLTHATPGLLGYSSRAELVKTVEEAKTAQKGQLERIAAASVDEILKDPNMLAFARAGGAAAFKVNCVQCHGSGAAGSAGYPNLNDDDWLWGGAPEQIHATLQNGVRYVQNADTRQSVMPAFGADGILQPDEIAAVAGYALTFSGGSPDPATAETGKTLYIDNCAACHGEDGKGSKELGAPNLSDKLWLYGGTLEEVTAQVKKPRHGVMPAWAQRLDETTVKQLAVYVHSLGGGEQAIAQ